MQRQHFGLARFIKLRGHHYRVKPAGSREAAVKLGQIFRLVIVAFFKGDQVLQVLVADLRAFEGHIAEAVAFPAVVIDVPERLMPVERDAQLAFVELAVEVAFAQRHFSEIFFEAVIIAVIEHGAVLRPRIQQIKVVMVGARAATQHHVRAADQHRLARLDAGNQHLPPFGRRWTQLKVDGGFVIAERF